MTSDTLLRAHAMGCDGLCLSNPAKTRQIKRHNVCFVDDNDGLVSADHESEDPVGEAKCKMKVSSQRWYDLTDLANQKVAFHKTTWQMLAWEQLRKGELSVSQRDFGPIELKDHKGGAANIAYTSHRTSQTLALATELAQMGTRTTILVISGIIPLMTYVIRWLRGSVETQGGSSSILLPSDAKE